jgi:hypothetical protein
VVKVLNNGYAKSISLIAVILAAAVITILISSQRAEAFIMPVEDIADRGKQHGIVTKGDNVVLTFRTLEHRFIG